jgi:hypothetical protein
MPESIFSGTPRLSEWQRQLIGMLPYVGPAYTGIRGVNALVQFINRQMHPGGQLPINSETNNPPMYGGAGPTSQGQLPTTSETNNPPMYGGGGGAPAPRMDMAGLLGMWKDYFPSSALGRFAPSVPYGTQGTRGARGLGTPNPVFTGLSGPAVDWMGEIARRNLK